MLLDSKAKFDKRVKDKDNCEVKKNTSYCSSLVKSVHVLIITIQGNTAFHEACLAGLFEFVYAVTTSL